MVPHFCVAASYPASERVKVMQDGSSCGGEPFALRVIGDSMAPEFEDGCIIVVDPSGVVNDGSYVLARHQDEYIFRQLVFGEGTYYLKTLSGAEDDIEIPNLVPVEGVIIQQGRRRRADRKHYI
jgi:DNA polymerase V